jgi:hypothetical protein
MSDFEEEDSFEEDDFCDYCRNKGYYFIDGERNECFCLTQNDEE